MDEGEAAVAVSKVEDGRRRRPSPLIGALRSFAKPAVPSGHSSIS